MPRWSVSRQNKTQPVLECQGWSWEVVIPTQSHHDFAVGIQQGNEQRNTL